MTEQQLTIQVPLTQVESTLPYGLRVSWVDGKVDGVRVVICQGGPGMIISYGEQSYVLDMVEFCGALADTIEAAKSDPTEGG